MQSIMSTGAGDGDRFLPTGQVRARYGVSDMSLWRWLRDETLNFPRPIRISKRKYWRLSDLVEWERARAGGR